MLTCAGQKIETVSYSLEAGVKQSLESFALVVVPVSNTSLFLSTPVLFGPHPPNDCNVRCFLRIQQKGWNRMFRSD